MRGEGLKIKRAALFVSLAGLVLYGCDTAGMRTPPYVATVNSEKIYLSELQDCMTTELGVPRDSDILKDKRLLHIKEQVLENLIDEKIMLQRAAALSIKITDGELAKKIDEIKRGYSEERFSRLFAADKIHYEFWKEAQRRRMLLERVVKVDVNDRISVTDKDVQAYKKSRPREDAPVQRVRVLQILTYNQKHAETILKRLKGGEDFGRVARKESISPEAAAGGDLGYVRRGVLPEVIDRAVFSLPVGSTSEIVKSPYGFHIFKVTGRNGEGGKSRSPIDDSLREELRKQKEELMYRAWIKNLREKAVVKINTDVLNPGS
ncbi:MAG: peptidylprolyl isomerase [Deltaproteobacteria bacterium]|nr:peptidylprolyl isomerase [Deltaproteobacteria bacterium]